MLITFLCFILVVSFNLSLLDWKKKSLRRMLLSRLSFVSYGYRILSIRLGLLFSQRIFMRRIYSLMVIERDNALGAFIPVELVLKCRPLLSQMVGQATDNPVGHQDSLRSLPLGGSMKLNPFNSHCLTTKNCGAIKKAHTSRWLNLLKDSRGMDLKGACLVYAITFQTTCSPELSFNTWSLA